jgi:uncharacterized damage-inducible protein DinB
VANPYLFPGLELGPVAIERLVRLISPDSYDVSEGERFTVREVVAHLTDWETIFLDRMRAAVERAGTEIAVYDEGERALEFAYNTLNPLAEARRLRDLRGDTIRYLQGVPEAAWLNKVLHPERGEMSLMDLAAMILGHDMYHVEQLTEVLESLEAKAGADADL